MVKVKKTKIIDSFEKGPIRRSLFTNGATSMFHKMSGRFGASVNLYFLVGSVDETPKQYGINHMIEHMLFKEGEHTNYIKELELRGAEINAYTYKEYVCFEMNCMAKDLKKFMPKFLNLFLNPHFNEKEFVTEKKVILQELREDLDDHDTVGFEYFLSNVFPSKIGHPIGGTLESVKNINLKQMINYYRRNFTTDKMLLSVVSGKDFKLEEVLLDNFSNLGLTDNKAPSRIATKDTFGRIQSFPLKKIKRKMETALVFIGMKGVALDYEHYMDLVLLNELLCEGLSSKYFIEMREKEGLIYSMSSSINSFAENGNYLLAFQTQKKLVETVKNKALSILDYYLENEFDKKEVELIKKRLSDGWDYSLDDIDERNEYIASFEIYNKKDFSLKRQRFEIEKCTPKSIKTLLGKIYPQKLSILVMEPS